VEILSPEFTRLCAKKTLASSKRMFAELIGRQETNVMEEGYNEQTY